MEIETHLGQGAAALPGSTTGPSGDISVTTSPSRQGARERCAGWEQGFRMDSRDLHPRSPMSAPQWGVPQLVIKPQIQIPPGTTSLASTLTGSWSAGPAATSAQRPLASPTSSLTSSPTCSRCPVGSSSLSSRTTSCVLVRRALRLRSPSPCCHLLTALLLPHAGTWSHLYLPSQSPAPSFLKESGVRSPSLRPLSQDQCPQTRPAPPISCPCPGASWPWEGPWRRGRQSPER